MKALQRTAPANEWVVNRLTGSLAAEVIGVDLSGILEEQIPSVTDLFVKHHVLVFRDQSLDNTGLIRFGRFFGELSQYPGNKEHTADDAGHVMALRNDAHFTQLTDRWHTDAPIWERPPSITVLRAEKLPEAGGDTLFSNQHRAFDSLSDGFKHMLRSMKAVHAYSYGAHGTKGRVHPAVRTHPVTGREALYVNEITVSQFDGMTIEESQPILRFLFEHATRPDFGYRHRWRQGDVVMWDNRSVLHRATHDYGDDPDARLMCNVQSLPEPVV